MHDAFVAAQQNFALDTAAAATVAAVVAAAGAAAKVGQCRLTGSKPVLKALMVSALEATI